MSVKNLMGSNLEISKNGRIKKTDNICDLWQTDCELTNRLMDYRHLHDWANEHGKSIWTE